MQIYMIISIAVVYLLFTIGALGTFLPILPGVAIAFLGLLGFKLFMPEAPISWTAVIIALALTVFAQLIDIFTSWFGAKKFGATWKGCFGAFVGVFVGIFIPPPLLWIFIAPFFGAFLFEYLGGANFKAAGWAGLGAFIGTIVATIIKFLIVVLMATYFTIEVVFYYWK